MTYAQCSAQCAAVGMVVPFDQAGMTASANTGCNINGREMWMNKGGDTTVLKSVGAKHKAGKDTKLKLSVLGSSLVAFVDGSQVMSYNEPDMKSGNKLAKGTIGVSASGARGSKIGDIQVGFVASARAELARGKPTKQAHVGWGGSSYKAVDGNTAQNYGSGSCTHTHHHHNWFPNTGWGKATRGWWRVDLEQEANVESVQIWNRADCCGSRLSRFVVEVGNRDCPGCNGSPCENKQQSIGQGAIGSITCNKQGRYVYIRYPDKYDYLTLCEVKVWGQVPAGLPMSSYSEKLAMEPCGKKIIDSQSRYRQRS